MTERASLETTSSPKAKTAKAGKAGRLAKKTKKRVKQVISEVLAFITCSKNNTIVSITDLQGNVKAWSTAGKRGYKGSKKPTPAAAEDAAKDAAEIAIQLYGSKKVDVFVKGPGAGREAAVRALKTAGLNVNCMSDTTPIAHGGCRPKKKRRV